MKFFQTLNIFEISCTKITKCVQNAEKSWNRNKVLSWGNCFEPKYPNVVKSDKNKYYSHKRLLSLRPHIVKFICEISKFKIKWKELVLGAGRFVGSPLLNIFPISLKKKVSSRLGFIIQNYETFKPQMQV